MLNRSLYQVARIERAGQRAAVLDRRPVPAIHASRPDRIEFVVGTQITWAPHLGTNLVQTAAFQRRVTALTA